MSALHDVDPPPGTLVLLTSVMAAAPAINYALAAAGPEVVASGLVSTAQLASLPAITFVLAALLGRACVAASDRFAVGRQLQAVLLLAALSLLVAAIGHDYWWFLAAAVIAAPGQALCNSLTNRAIRAQAPVAAIPSWTGIKQSGVQVGQFVVGAAVSAAVGLGSMGWRPAVLGVGMVALVLMVAGRRPAARLSASVRPTRARASRAALPVGVGATIIVVGLTGFAMQTLNVFLPLFVAAGLGAGPTLGAVAVAVVGVTGLGARIVVARGLARGSDTGTILVVATVLAVLVPLHLWLAERCAPWFVWIAAVIAGSSLLTVSTVANSLVIRECPPNSIGRVSAALSIAMYVGFALGPLTTGTMLHVTGSFALSWVPSALALLGSVAFAIAASHQRRA